MIKIRKIRRKEALMLLITALLYACSGEQVYQGIQQNRQNNCQWEHLGADYRECMARWSRPYEEYRREREQLLRSGE